MSRKRQLRDEQGWRVPQPDTVSYKIYEMMKEGVLPADMMVRLNGKVASRSSLGVLMWKIRNPEDSNQTTYNSNKRKKA